MLRLRISQLFWGTAAAFVPDIDSRGTAPHTTKGRVGIGTTGDWITDWVRRRTVYVQRGMKKCLVRKGRIFGNMYKKI